MKKQNTIGKIRNIAIVAGIITITGVILNKKKNKKKYGINYIDR